VIAGPADDDGLAVGRAAARRAQGFAMSRVETLLAAPSSGAWPAMREPASKMRI
jgi:hypothetical protein